MMRRFISQLEATKVGESISHCGGDKHSIYRTSCLFGHTKVGHEHKKINFPYESFSFIYSQLFIKDDDLFKPLVEKIKFLNHIWYKVDVTTFKIFINSKDTAVNFIFFLLI